MRNILKNYRIFDIDSRKLRSKDFFKNMLEYRTSVMKEFKKTIKKASDFSCPLCLRTAGKPFLKYKNYPLFECKKCGLVSPNIDFKKLETETVYNDPKYKKNITKEVLNTYKYRKEKYAPERINYLLEKVDIPKNKLKVLDIGCGSGYFISHLKGSKIKYKGLEVAEFHLKICKKMGLNAASNDLKDEKDNEYNAATMFDVIEHLSDPVYTFKTLNKKIKEGGYVLAYTPHIHSAGWLLMRGLQNTLLPFQHLAFFDEKSLEYLAKKTGFKVHSIEYYGLDIIDYFYMRQWQDKIDYHKKLKDFIPIMQAIIDKQKLGNHMRVVFKKSKNL